MSFSDWLEAQGYGRKWVVASTLTPKLAAKGFDKAIPQAAYLQLQRDYEAASGDAAQRLAEYYQNTYGASLLEALLRRNKQ